MICVLPTWWIFPLIKCFFREGGCGACIVTLSVEDPVTGKKINRAVNSVSLTSVHFGLTVNYFLY